jgi:hypothetical protein
MKTIDKILRDVLQNFARHIHLGKIPIGLALLILSATQALAGSFVQQGSLISSLSGTNSATNCFKVNVAANTNLPIALGPAFSISGIGSQGLMVSVELLASHAAGNTNNGTINLMLTPSVDSTKFAIQNPILLGVAHNGVTSTIWFTNIDQSVFGGADSVRLYNITTTNIGTFSISNVLARAILTSY